MADFCVYILYSKEIDKFYIGETEDLDQRIKFHLKKEFSNCNPSSFVDLPINQTLPQVEDSFN